MKVLITGGHMAPALAVIEALPKDIEVVYVGRKHPFEGDKGISLEYQTITSYGIPFICLSTARIQRVLTFHTLPSLLKFPMGFFHALRILKKEKPDLVVGFGGYISFPVGIASKILGIPLIIHEQTFKAGLANRLLSKFAQIICISWEDSKKYFPEKNVVVTGNPLMKNNPTKDIDSLLPLSKENLPLLVVTGGSAGSHAINLLIESSLEILLEKYKILHQTGDAKEFNDFQRLMQKNTTLPQKLQKRYSVQKFIDTKNIYTIFQKADLVIGRAGINTITTLLHLQKPSFLIPLLSGQQNEQLTNALFLKKCGLANVYEQEGLSPSGFVEEIDGMIKSIRTYSLKQKIVLPKDAAQKMSTIIQLCMEPSKKEKLATFFEK